MRVPSEWLNEFVSFAEEQIEQLAEGLTLQGVSVEEIESHEDAFSGVVCGRVLSVEKHPDADRLSICQVDVGQEQPLQIVTGASNVVSGRWVPVALDGANLPGGKRINTSKLRGVLSQGMLCSAEELGLELQVPDGILLLEETTGPIEPGLPLEKHLRMHEPVLILELTPNYAAHCQSIYGVAVETAAMLGTEVTEPTFTLTEDESATCRDRIEIQLQATDGCPRYVARVIENVTVGPSPMWLQRRLQAAGLRSVNNIVDVTNYVMLEYGQPLHAFDLDKLQGGTVYIRHAEDHESLVTIDGRRRVLERGDLVIADAQGPIAIAGVMGGKDTEVSEQTRNILLESASFDAMTISKSSRKMGLRSEASTRYEKGSDPNLPAKVAARAAYLIQQLAGGRVLSQPIDAYPNPVRPSRIRLRLKRVNQLLGSSLKVDDVSRLLQRLQCVVVEKDDDEMLVEVPTRRVDLISEVDLVEEVGRMYGYNRIAADLPRGEIKLEYDFRRAAVKRVKTYWQQVGLNEAINLPFSNPGTAEAWQWPEDDPRRQMIPLANPLTLEQSHMRTSLLPNLLASVQMNLRRGQQHIAFFEMSRVYRADVLPLQELPQEPMQLALALTGDWAPPNWLGEQQTVDFYLLKGLLLDFLGCFGLNGVVSAGRYPGFHPGRTARLSFDGGDQEIDVGYFGELHPLLLREYDINQRVYMAEIDLEVLLNHVQLTPRYKKLPRFPAVQRDLSFVISRDTPVDRIERVIRSAAGDILEEVRLFDVYEGDVLPVGKRSLAFRLTYRSEDRTLRDDEVEPFHQAVRDRLREELEAELRS